MFYNRARDIYDFKLFVSNNVLFEHTISFTLISTIITYNGMDWNWNLIFWKITTHLSSASFIHLSRTGLIFCALFGVMSNFSNLEPTTSYDSRFSDSISHIEILLLVKKEIEISIVKDVKILSPKSPDIFWIFNLNILFKAFVFERKKIELSKNSLRLCSTKGALKKACIDSKTGHWQCVHA